MNLLMIYEVKINENNNEFDTQVSNAEKNSSFLLIEKKGILKKRTHRSVNTNIIDNVCVLKSKSNTILNMFHVKQISGHIQILEF